MTTSAAKEGAFKDPTAGQTNDGSTAPNGGGMSTGIGIGTFASIYDRNAGSKPISGFPGFVNDDIFVADRIGSITDNDRFTFVPFDAALDADMTYHVADIALDDGDQDVLTGNYNHQGGTIQIGQEAWLVGAAS